MEKNVIPKNDVTYSPEPARVFSSILVFINEVRTSLKEKNIEVKCTNDLYGRPDGDEHYWIGFYMQIRRHQFKLCFGCWIRQYERHSFPIQFHVLCEDVKTKTKYYQLFEKICAANKNKLIRLPMVDAQPIAAVNPEFLDYFRNYDGVAKLFAELNSRFVSASNGA